MKRIFSFRATKYIACEGTSSLNTFSRNKCLLYGISAQTHCNSQPSVSSTQHNNHVSNDLSLLSTNGRTSCINSLPIRNFHSTTKDLSVSSILSGKNISVLGDRKCLLEHPVCCNVFLTQQQWTHRWSNKKSLNQDADKRQNLTRKNSPSSQGRGSASKGGSDGSKDSGDGEENLSLYQRFKKTYKENGYVLIGVHCLTSAVWFGSFYGVAVCGLDIVPFFEWLNFPEVVLSKLRAGGGNLAVAYILYKIATPARYTVTIGGTTVAVRYLRKAGYLKPVSEENKLRSLYKEGKADLKTRHAVRIRRYKSYKNNSRVVSRFRKMRNRFKNRKRKSRK